MNVRSKNDVFIKGNILSFKSRPYDIDKLMQYHSYIFIHVVTHVACPVLKHRQLSHVCGLSFMCLIL